MSQLIIKGHRSKQYKLNVTQFRSPMNAQINSVQTKTMAQHFPIRAGQPDINFTVKFNSRATKTEFQNFVREHQLFCQVHGDDGRIFLWWPERNIENWTGFIVNYKVVERGFKDPAPSVTFGVALLDSLMSERTTISSFGAHWTSIWGPQIPAYRGPGPLLDDDILQPPIPPNSTNPPPASDSPRPPSPVS